MVDTVRTQNYLLTQVFQDNQPDESISQQDMRDFIVSLSVLLKQVRVVTVSGPITVTATDAIIIVNKTVGEATAITLIPAPTVGQFISIKEGKGDGGANNLTISPTAGTIDGASSVVISTNFGFKNMVYNGTQWNVV